MSTRDDGSASRPTTPRTARSTRWLLVGAAAVLAALLGMLVLTAGGDGGAPASADRAAPATAAVTDAAEGTTPPPPPPPPPTPTPSGPTDDVDALPSSLPDVPLDGTAGVGNGITATLRGPEPIDGRAVGPGNTAGPALRITVRITNGTPEPVSLDAVAVALAHGRDLTPASPLEDPSQVPFSGTVAPGATAEGTYVFTVPADDREVVTVSVGYQAGAPFLVFSGSAA